MSITNAWLTRDEVLLLVDTAVGGAAGMAIGEGSKAIPLVHMNAVIATRGYYAFFLVAQVHCLSQGGSFDELVDRLPLLLREASHNYAEVRQKLNLAEFENCPAYRNGLVAAGWSGKLGCMRLVSFERMEEEGDFVKLELTAGHYLFAPGFAELPPLKRPVTWRELANVARLQVRLTREKFPSQSHSAAIGGRLIGFQIRRAGMTIAPIGDLA